MDARDTGGTTDKHNLVNLLLLKTGVLQDLLHRVQSTREALSVEILKASTSKRGVEILAIKQRINLDSGLGGVGQSALGTLTGSSQAAQSPGIAGKVLSSLALELLLEVVKEVGIEILTTKMSVTSGGLDGENAALDVEERDIESTTTKIIDQDITLLVRLSRAKTIGNGGGSGLVNDTENIEAGNRTSVLGSLTLVVVEVSRDSDDRLFDLLAQLGLRDLFHLLM